MTNSPLEPVSEAQAPLIRLPRLATGLLIISLLLLMFGGLTYIGTAYSGYNIDLFQTKLGIGIFCTGALFLAIGLVLVGVRSIAQQVVDALHRKDRS
jgi:hypothetical protein